MERFLDYARNDRECGLNDAPSVIPTPPLLSFRLSVSAWRDPSATLGMTKGVLGMTRGMLRMTYQANMPADGGS